MNEAPHICANCRYWSGLENRTLIAGGAYLARCGLSKMPNPLMRSGCGLSTAATFGCVAFLPKLEQKREPKPKKPNET